MEERVTEGVVSGEDALADRLCDRFADRLCPRSVQEPSLGLGNRGQRTVLKDPTCHSHQPLLGKPEGPRIVCGAPHVTARTQNGIVHGATVLRQHTHHRMRRL